MRLRMAHTAQMANDPLPALMDFSDDERVLRGDATPSSAGFAAGSPSPAVAAGVPSPLSDADGDLHDAPQHARHDVSLAAGVGAVAASPVGARGGGDGIHSPLLHAMPLVPTPGPQGGAAAVLAGLSSPAILAAARQPVIPEPSFADVMAGMEARLDSKLVVEQMSGRWAIKNAGLREIALELRNLGGSVRYTWVPREQNTFADRLANEALDEAAAGRTDPIARYSS